MGRPHREYRSISRTPHSTSTGRAREAKASLNARFACLVRPHGRFSDLRLECFGHESKMVPYRHG